MHILDQPAFQTPPTTPDWESLLYFVVVAFVGVGVDGMRRWLYKKIDADES